MMSLMPDCLPLGLLGPVAVALKQCLPGSNVEGVMVLFQEGFQSKEEVALGDDQPPLHSQEVCNRSRTLD